MIVWLNSLQVPPCCVSRGTKKDKEGRAMHLALHHTWEEDEEEEDGEG